MSNQKPITNAALSAPAPPSKPFRILSLDGGGIRAIVQAILIQRLAKEFPEFLDQVDMFAGASAGSIVAIALANGLTPTQTTGLWENEVGKIFSESIYSRITNLDNAIGAPYRNDELKNMLVQTVGNKRLCDLQKKLLVPTFNLDPIGNAQDASLHSNAVELSPHATTHVTHLPDGSKAAAESNPSASEVASSTSSSTKKMDLLPCRRWAPEFFHNFSHSQNSETSLVDVCLRTTAAPTFFPIYQGYIDGGTYANCPALAAVMTAVSAGIKIEDIVVLSISTGNNPQFIGKETYKDGNWGLFEWGPKIVDLLLDANTQSINHHCNCLLQQRYHRIDPVLTTNVGLDQAAAVPDLEKLANEINLDEIIQWLKDYWIKENFPLKTEGLKEENEGWKCIIQ